MYIEQWQPLMEATPKIRKATHPLRIKTTLLSTKCDKSTPEIRPPPLPLEAGYHPSSLLPVKIRSGLGREVRIVLVFAEVALVEA